MVSSEGLLERVKAATGPDRELDGAIEVQARRFDAYRAGLDDRTRAHWKHAGSTVYDGNTGYIAANFTTSIDAALALVERCLPGWFVDHMGADASGSTGDMKTFGWTVEVSDNMTGHQGSAPTLPLAILGALISALKDASE